MQGFNHHPHLHLLHQFCTLAPIFQGPAGEEFFLIRNTSYAGNLLTLPSSPFCIGVPVTHHRCTLFKCSATSAAFKMQNTTNSNNNNNNNNNKTYIALISIFLFSSALKT